MSKCLFEKKECPYANVNGNSFKCTSPNDEEMLCNPESKRTYKDGDEVLSSLVRFDFEFGERNDFLKYESYYSKDGEFVATIYDDADYTLIERA